MKKSLIIVLTLIAVAAHAYECNAYQKVDLLCSGGTISATQDPDDDCTWTLTANPAAGYRFAYWTNLYGNKSYEPTIEMSIDPDYQNTLWQATFVRANAYIYEWTGDSVVYRSTNTDILSGVDDAGSAEIDIEGAHEFASNPTVDYVDYGVWRKQTSGIGDGNIYAGKSMHVVLYNSCGQPSAVIDAIVPVMVAEDTDASSLDFHSDVANTDVEVFDGATLTIDVDKTINGYLNIHAGGKVVVEEGKTLTVNGITMRGNGITQKWAQLAIEGNIVNNNSNTIYYDYTLDNRAYYPLALPYTMECASATNAITGGTPRFLSYVYNSTNRENGTAAWEAYDDEALGATFDAGKGYIIYAVPSDWNGSRQRHAVMRFPMVANFSGSGEDQVTEGVKTVDSHTNNAEGIDDEDRNWNFIGNPYLTSIILGHATPAKYTAFQGNMVNDEFVPTTYGSRSLRYITYSTDGYRSYRQEQMSSFEMKPFNSYFTQTSFGSKIQFNKIPEEASAPRRASEDNNAIEELETGIILSQGDKSDCVGLLFGDFTDNYELNADLAKEFGSAQPMSAYSLMGTTPMAFQALSIDAMTRPIPVGYRKAGSEQMTFSFDDSRYNRSLIDGLWLTDIVTGQVTNLLVEDYTFTPESAQDDSRFYLSCERRKVVDVTTDVEEANQQRNIIRVFDMFGREMRGDINSLPQGVYVLMDNLGNTTKEILGK